MYPRPNHWNAILVLLLMIGAVFSQTASLASSHSQDHASHCCGVCHTGHVSLLQPVDHHAFVSLTLLCWHRPLESAERAPEPSIVLDLSRAPPV
jgi:hypothetical protein